MSAPDVRVASDPATCFAGAADAVSRALAETIRSHAEATLVLSGGGTPRGLHRLLVSSPWRERVAWSAVRFFFGDERCVPPDHPDSNFRMASETLLSPLGIRPEQVHRIEGERPPTLAARRYDDLLRRRGDGRAPRFDLVLLGLGEDGHTASLFPGSAALEERERLSVAVRGPKPPPDRVTLTFPVFEAAREVLFLACGAGKADAIRRIRAGEDLPAARVRPAEGRLSWFVDRAAAGDLRD